jgi:hypothetical protein
VFTLRSGNSLVYLERLRVTGMGAITTLASFLVGAFRLQSIEVPATFANAVTTAANAFEGCRSLGDVDLSGWGFDTSLTNTSTMFGNSTARNITFAADALDGVTNASNMVANSGCYIPYVTLALPAATNISSFCTNNPMITYVEFTELGAITTISAFAQGCASLRHVKFPASMTWSSLTTTTSAFTSCTLLARLENCQIPVSFSIASCRFGAAELDELYTDLPTVVGQTVTVTSNYGAASDDPTIATAKGWTVTG